MRCEHEGKRLDEGYMETLKTAFTPTVHLKLVKKYVHQHHEKQTEEESKMTGPLSFPYPDCGGGGFMTHTFFFFLFFRAARAAYIWKFPG